ncbi:GNAT family N-acetyltransferase [Caulobacter sp. SLTY]|uniref:GNAT family N-acetyltransferase n=1 Tax=Caulobacter sp. SLTY TaxID=2683262 RepID=UPI0014125843|nr:GNAT family N-acetyltransferase [Caulobacter sp. SLTY]NBB16766.1 GNAT family N-acetyltransferase [Caulobacter sp. SLTY]
MIETERLILRDWRSEDLEPWAAMNADPKVMRYFPAVLTRPEAEAVMVRAQAHIDEHGFGFWAVERKADRLLLGFTGLKTLAPDNPLAPGVEAGWRLSRHAWGQGYASEAARASLAHGFGPLGLKSIVAFTATDNLPSQAVMTRIGMIRRKDLDFDHPALPKGHPLERHVVWEARA